MIIKAKGGLFVGYDPGGDGAHGVAQLSFVEGKASIPWTTTLKTAEEVVAVLQDFSTFAGIGVDTLTCWSTGAGGWRPADRWLREKYKEVRNSVVTPNGLAGSMGLNGMSVLLAVRGRWPNIPVVETHPKVLYWALAKRKHNYASSKAEMETILGAAVGAEVATANDHEWDALLSAFAAASGVLGRWKNDLHTLPIESGERIMKPCGTTNYYWPS